MNSGYYDGENGIESTYHDGHVFSKNLKNGISRVIGDHYMFNEGYGEINYGESGKMELTKAVKSSNLNFKSSDRNIFKVNKNKNSITVTGVGIAYLTFTIPETEHFKSFNGKMKIVSYPPDADLGRYPSKLKSGKIKWGGNKW